MLNNTSKWSHARGNEVVPSRWQATVLKAGKGPTDLLFTGTRGGVLRNMNFRRDVFDYAAKAAGLDGLTPHELRHTAASLAVSSRPVASRRVATAGGIPGRISDA